MNCFSSTAILGGAGFAIANWSAAQSLEGGAAYKGTQPGMAVLLESPVRQAFKKFEDSGAPLLCNSSVGFIRTCLSAHFAFQFPLYPGPRNALPGRSPVCFP